MLLTRSVVRLPGGPARRVYFSPQSRGAKEPPKVGIAEFSFDSDERRLRHIKFFGELLATLCRFLNLAMVIPGHDLLGSGSSVMKKLAYFDRRNRHSQGAHVEILHYTSKTRIMATARP